MAFLQHKGRAANHFNLEMDSAVSDEPRDVAEDAACVGQDNAPLQFDTNGMEGIEEKKLAGSKEELPSWMKSKLPGVKKVTNKERRRRQNQHLRRLLTPKNAVMVINEMIPKEQIANNFKVEPNPNKHFKQTTPTYCADLTIDGTVYQGYGENKLLARSAAAEQAVRDIIIKKIKKCAESSTEPAEEEPLPMIQLASFALHKLFSEWEGEGYKVPLLRPAAASVSDSESTQSGPVGGATAGAVEHKPSKPAKIKTLPSNASTMHPCMLLAYMKPAQEYRELAVDGDKPQNMMFTIGLVVDGKTYVGKAPNKREARKAAARVACETLFGVEFADRHSENTPRH
ncbi:uncharacterized protein LOC101741377 isoform X2 [Bombyx mori]|nr:uncharacterized protein LOC101741377 isoform X2 [Bombyx mori]XP_037868589.1 uncharacterized protein LOC101741377 isoform X2 [Bombyx mori]